MALQFQPPPDWLLKEYIDSKNRNPVTEGLNAALPVAQLYLQQKQLGKTNELAQQQAEIQKQQLILQQQKAAREQGQYAMEYAPAELPGAGGAYNKYATQDMGEAQGPALTGDAQLRSLLTQSGGQATLGANMGTSPSSPVIDHWNSGFGMNQNASLAKAPQTPQEEANLQFANEFPFGIKGQDALTRKDRAARAFDDKRTFQEKQEVSVDGEPVGYMAFDTRSGSKYFRSYYPEKYPDGDVPAGSVFIPKVKPEIPSGAVEKNAAQVGFLDLIKDIRDNYDKDFVGPIDSKWTNLKQTVDMPSIGMGATKKAADFTRPIADLQSAIVNERTGAAVGERKEWDRLAAILADVSRSDTDFLAKLDNVEKRYNQIIENRNTAFGKTGYRNPSSGGKGGSETPAQRKARLIQELLEGR